MSPPKLETETDSLLATRICRYYRTKAMFSRESGPSPVLVNERTIRFPYGWCAKSSSEIGPDDFVADADACADCERGCHQR